MKRNPIAALLKKSSVAGKRPSMTVARCILGGALLLLAPRLHAQPNQYHLVIVGNEGGVTTVRYASLAACERARQAIIANMEERRRVTREGAPRGVTVLRFGYQIDGLCIPA